MCHAIRSHACSSLMVSLWVYRFIDEGLASTRALHDLWHPTFGKMPVGPKTGPHLASQYTNQVWLDNKSRNSTKRLTENARRGSSFKYRPRGHPYRACPNTDYTGESDRETRTTKRVIMRQKRYIWPGRSCCVSLGYEQPLQFHPKPVQHQIGSKRSAVGVSCLLRESFWSM